MNLKESINKLRNNRVDAEKSAGARVLLAQHPRPSRFFGHDWRPTREKSDDELVSFKIWGDSAFGNG